MTLPDPATLWHATAPGLAPFPALAGAAEADLAVVGGGFAGLSTALHAAAAGLSVVLLEANRIAWGASGRNAGFVVPNFAKVDPDGIRAMLGLDRGDRLVRMAAGSADLVFGLIRDHGIDCDARQDGWLQPSHSDAALARARDRVRQWQGQGRPVEMLEAAAVAALTAVPGWRGGWIDRSGGTLNPVGYARGLARAAAAAGARLHEGSPVTSLSAEAGGWRLDTPAGRLTARRVVLATNAHAGTLWPGLAQGFFPLRVFQIATAPIPAADRARLLPAGMALSDSRRNLFTYRQDAGGRLITGGMHVLGPGADRRVPRAILNRLARAIGMPGKLTLSYAWSGLAAVSPDFLPRVIEPAPGLIAGLACNGRGIAMTTAMGRELADWATGRPAEALALPLAPLWPIPFHALMRLAPNVLLPVSLLRDRMESPPDLPR
jgi:glycine/D-amino acid oxidase-like deaminating enzyme